MNRIVLDGVDGANPLGFLASVGLLRLLSTRGSKNARLGFDEDFRACIWCEPGIDPAELVAGDAAEQAGPQPWRLEYKKVEKKGENLVADLKAPPEEFRRFLRHAVDAWVEGRGEGAAYLAGFGTDAVRDGKGNTKPTAFHFTAAHQQFLGIVEGIRASVAKEKEWARGSLNVPGQAKPGSNLRWNPDAERSRALMGVDPSTDDTVVNAPLEWLAFRALPLFPCVPRGNSVLTTGVAGRRQNEMRFVWPLWQDAASLASVRSLLQLPVATMTDAERQARGIFAVCSSDIRRTSQGFGNFAPAHVNGLSPRGALGGR